MRSTPSAQSMPGNEAGQTRNDNAVKMTLVWCPPGPFKLDRPKQVYDRRANYDRIDGVVTQGFWLGKYEVTQWEWKDVMQTEPWKGEAGVSEGVHFPATFVGWGDAMHFCRNLTDIERKAGRLPKGWEYNLPTEAQWGRACGAGTETTFSFGNDASKLGEYAWFRDNFDGASKIYAHQVGQKKANPWGLFDMYGNVSEWVRDIYPNTLPNGEKRK